MNIFALVGAALLAPGSPMAGHFRLCDGFAAPSAVSDGLDGKWSWGYTEEEPPEGTDTLSWAVLACEQALADPALLSTHSRRRASLLRGKATWQLQLGRNSEALDALARSDSIASEWASDPAGNRFIATNRLLRAYAHYKMGQLEEGRAELQWVEDSLLYSYDFTDLARRLRFTLDRDGGRWQAALRSRAPIDPSVLRQLFWLSLYEGDFPGAIELAPQVYFDPPRGRDDFNLTGEGLSEFDITQMRADHAGATAYAFAAMGDMAASNAAIEKGRAAIDLTHPPSRGKAPTAAEEQAYRVRVTSGEHAMGRLDSWQQLIAFRVTVPTLSLMQLGTSIRKPNSLGGMVALDLLRQLRPTNAMDEAEIREIISGLEQRRDKTVGEHYIFGLTDLAKRLLRPETDGPRLKAAGPNFMFDDSNGFYVKRDKDTGHLNIRYGSKTETKGQIEDMALLAAAIYTQKAGKDSFLVLSHLYIDREIHTQIAYGGGSYRTSNGHEARLRILPVDASNIPEEHQPSRWRVIRASDVVNRLQPIYMAPTKKKR